MFWFTKKKDEEEDEKESSVLAIETMHDDLEHLSKDKEVSTTKEDDKEQKPLKKSPFLMGTEPEKKPRSDQSQNEDKKTDKDKEQLFPHPASAITINEPPKVAATKETAEKPETAKESAPKINKTEKQLKPAVKKELKKDKDDGNKHKTTLAKKLTTEEEKMEKIVKAASPKAPFATPKIPVPPAEKPALKPQEKKVVEKEEKKEELITSPPLPKQTAQPPIKKAATTSPFGVPKKGIASVKPKKFTAKQDFQEKSSFSKSARVITVIIIILTLAAAGYYYYQNFQQDSFIKLPLLSTSSTPSEPKAETDNFNSAIVLQTSTESLLTDLRVLVKNGKSSNLSKFAQGQFVKPLKNEQEHISGAEILKIFGSEDPAINNFLADSATIFVIEERLTNTEATATKEAIKLSLLLEIKKDVNSADVIKRLTEIETTLPGTLKNLMIDEDVEMVNKKIVFNQATPETNDSVNVVRYFNFKPGDTTQSIEWGLLSYKNKAYIFFTTSKNSTNSLIEALY